MENIFYITAKDLPQGDKWYNLKVLPTHFCVACGEDLNRIKSTIKKYVSEFDNEPDLILRALKDTTSGGKVSRASFEQSEKYYKEYGKDYADFITQAVQEVAKERKEKFKKKLSGKFSKKKPLIKRPVDSGEEEDIEPVEEQQPLKVKARFNFKKK